MIINIYDNDTEILVASVKLNDVLSRRVKSVIAGDWDEIGEYDLTDLIEDV